MVEVELQSTLVILAHVSNAEKWDIGQGTFNYLHQLEHAEYSMIRECPNHQGL